MNSTRSLSCLADVVASQWFETTLGQYLLAKEQVLFDAAVADLFGFNAVQMGCPTLDFLKNSRIPNRFMATHHVQATPNHQINVYCDEKYLPFDEQSLDLLLLPHKLEFSVNPHQTLREAERVLVHEGHLMIAGFNPLSVWGITSGIKKLMSNHAPYPWHGRFISLTRIKDWLALMGFEVVSFETTCAMLPFEKALRCKHLSGLDALRLPVLSGVYFIVAKKRVAGMTPLKPTWSQSLKSSRLVVMPVPTSSHQATQYQTSTQQLVGVEPTPQSDND